MRYVLACVAAIAALASCMPFTNFGATGRVDQRAGAWWGDVNTPHQNQVWVEVFDAAPGASLEKPTTFHWTCHLPKFTDAPQTERLDYSALQVNSQDLRVVGHPAPDQQMAYTLTPAAFGPDEVEVRVRCVAHETIGPNAGHQTGATAGFPVKLNGGTGGDVWNHHNDHAYLDAHGWYDRGVEYEYANFVNAVALMRSAQHGNIPIVMHGQVAFGRTVEDHLRFLVDGKTVAEWMGPTTDRTYQLDTRRLANGVHTFAVHSHGLETTRSGQPGKQIAGQVEVLVRVQN
jgi:hypothetical protein